jgi:hypothetical protein
MNPLVLQILATLGPVLSREVNVQALESCILSQELTNPLSDPIPGIIASAATIFPDPTSQTLIVAVLTYIDNKGKVTEPSAA